MQQRESGADAPTILIVGASRGLGHAIAAEHLRRGWRVIGTVRAGGAPTPLHALAEASNGRLEVETVDICEPGEVAALRGRLSGRRLDALFVNAGVTNDPNETIGAVSAAEFTRVMVTNALSPMRVVEAFEDLVPPDGLVGVMSSGQGSVSNNETGLREVYRASKAALNTLMRSFAARHAASPRASVLIAPGWVRTEMGGPGAPLGIGDSVPGIVDVLVAKRGRPGLEYLDYRGRTVPW